MKLFKDRATCLSIKIAGISSFTAAALIPVVSQAQTSPANNDYRLYGVTFFGNELIQVDPGTGQGTLVGSLGANVNPFGVANRNGSLFTFNSSLARVQPVDLTSGAVGAGIDIGVTGVQGEGDIAFSPSGTGFLFAALDSGLNVVNNLYTFDITSGTSRRVGSSSLTLDGLAFLGNLLYATAQGDANLYLVNQNDASLFPVGALGVDANSPFQGLAATPDGGLRGAINDRLYRINPFTGAATEVDGTVLDLGFSSVSGLTSVAVPEPATWALIIVGGLGLLGLRRPRSA